MNGLQERGKQAVDVILTLWNEKNCGIVYSLYQHTVQVHQGAGSLIYGRENLLASILEIHAAFPDLHLTVDHSTADQDEEGIVRVWISWSISGTFLGFSSIGDPTGNTLELNGISLLRMEGSRIIEQWDSIDTASLMIQLGLKDTEILSRFSRPRPLFDPVQAGETERIIGQDAPAAIEMNGDSRQFVRYLMNQLWNFRNAGVLEKTYDIDAVSFIPGYAESVNRQEYRNFVFSLIRIFPDLRCYIDEISEIAADQAEKIVYLRWTLQGSHRQGDRFGEPTGRQVTIPVISSYRFEKGKIVEEHLVFDEVKLQLALFPYRRELPDKDIEEQEDLL